MKEAAEKPEGFTVVIKGGIAHVERNLEFEKDTIRLQLQIKPDNLGQASVVDLHRLCLEKAIRHLQDLLDKSMQGEKPQA